jgi:hypothetical protein
MVSMAGCRPSFGACIMALLMFRSAESRSGLGSELQYTVNARRLLERALRDLNVSSWIDAPCGDCNWQPAVRGIERVRYLGLDIVPELIANNNQRYADRPNFSFAVQDFVVIPLPFTPDLILNRDMIQHQSLRDGVRAYANLEASGATYLVTTWLDGDAPNDPAAFSGARLPCAGA